MTTFTRSSHEIWPQARRGLVDITFFKNGWWSKCLEVQVIMESCPYSYSQENKWPIAIVFSVNNANARKDELDPIFIEGKGELLWIFHQHQIDIHRLSLGQENTLMHEQFYFSQRFFTRLVNIRKFLFQFNWDPRTFTNSWFCTMKLMSDWRPSVKSVLKSSQMAENA